MDRVYGRGGGQSQTNPSTGRMVFPLMLKVILPLRRDGSYIEGRCLDKDMILLGHRYHDKRYWTVYLHQTFIAVERDVSSGVARKTLLDSGWYLL